MDGMTSKLPHAGLYLLQSQFQTCYHNHRLQRFVYIGDEFLVSYRLHKTLFGHIFKELRMIRSA